MVVSVSLVLEERIWNPQLLVPSNVDVVKGAIFVLGSKLKPTIDPLLLETELDHVFLIKQEY